MYYYVNKMKKIIGIILSFTFIFSTMFNVSAIETDENSYTNESFVEPAKYVEKFAKLGAKIIYIHPETDPHACRTLQMIKDAGAKAGIAVNPGTTFETVKDLLHLCDYVMLMSVNPGFAGQKYLDFVTPKFKKFVEEAKNYGGYDVMIDGACSPEKIEMLSKIGVKGFILGTSALFGKGRSYQEIIEELRKL